MYSKNIEEILTKYNGSTTKEEKAKPWDGFKELVLVDKVVECDDITSFYFQAKDKKKLIKHRAGQFLPFKIKTEEPRYKDVMRTYSLSMIPNEYLYRISVKRIPNGLISNYLHDKLNIGDIIEAMIPLGVFTLDEKKENPVVFLAGGIGITPLLSMVYKCNESNRGKFFVQAVQNSKMHPFKRDLEVLEEKSNLKNIVFYDKPLEGDIQGKNYDFKGFITREWIEENLPLDSEFYFCGPPPFMRALNRNLLALGVKRENIHFEFFGEAESLE